MTDQSRSESRLDDLREEAWRKGAVQARGVDVAGGPIPRSAGYYGQAVLKAPVWTWEIPLYFFIGGMAGMAAVIALSAALFQQPDLARAAMRVSAAGAVLSPILLVLDLGRPRLFLNMLRVFKHRSAMSVGAWVLTIFGSCTLPGWLSAELHVASHFAGNVDSLLRLVAAVFILGAAISGTLLATYTGVLLGATVIPAWFHHRKTLPIHFGTAGLGSAAALLELLGYRIAPLNVIGFYAAAIESVLLIWLVLDRHEPADRAVHAGGSGWMIELAGALTGPLPLLLRWGGQVPLAATLFLVGALVSRFAWLAAGKVSAAHPESALA